MYDCFERYEEEKRKLKAMALMSGKAELILQIFFEAWAKEAGETITRRAELAATLYARSTAPATASANSGLQPGLAKREPSDRTTVPPTAAVPARAEPAELRALRAAHKRLAAYDAAVLAKAKRACSALGQISPPIGESGSGRVRAV